LCPDAATGPGTTVPSLVCAGVPMFGRLYRSEGIPEAARARAVAWTRESNAARAAGLGPAGPTAGAAGSEEVDGDLFAGKEAGSEAHEPSGVTREVVDKRPPNDEVTTVRTTRPSHSERGVRAVIRNKRAGEQMRSRRGPATAPREPTPTLPRCRRRTPTSYRVSGSRRCDRRWSRVSGRANGLRCPRG
jgi:hypothetical protein